MSREKELNIVYRPARTNLVAAGLLFVATLSMSANVFSQAANPPAMPPSIGPTPIRFYSGNLSVGLFRKYWGAQSGDDGITPERIATLKRCSCQAMCDYITWCTVERDPGQWDWSFYRRNAEMLEAAGLQYNVFCWLHFPPKWYLESDRFVGYRNLANGKTIPQISLWSPEILKIYDEFYARLAKELGSHIAFIRLAMPSEYGEIGYCSGMTKWLVPQDAAGPGYWCADPHAIAHFRAACLEKYKTLTALNAVWGTAFKTPDEITMPDPKASGAFASDQARTRWLDFIDWYQQSWVEFMTQSVAIVRKHFPEKEIILSLGYGGEAAFYGNDQGRFVKAMADLKVAAQTPGAIGYFATRRVSSACRAYNVPYFTEPPGNVPRDQQVLRIWMDGSNGTQTWFDYLQNMDGARDLFLRYKRYLTGKPPRCTLAFWLPTWHQYSHPAEAWPTLLGNTASETRDLCDYEVVDDHMLADGALEKLGIRVFALTSADVVSKPALQAVRRWVEGGGVFITFSDTPATVRGGTAQDWSELAKPRPVPVPLLDVRVKGPVPAAYAFSATEPQASPYLIGKWFGIDGAGEKAIHWCGAGGGLRLPVESGGAYRVHMRAGVPGHAGKVQIRSGKTVLHELQPGDETAVFELPSTLTDGRSYVDLIFAGKTWRPKDVQDTSDARELLINIGQVQVRRLEASGKEVTANPGPPPTIASQWKWDVIWKDCGNSLGKGRVLTIPREDRTPTQMSDLVAHFSHHIADYGPYVSALNVDGERDGVWATVFEKHVLYYNSGKQSVAKQIPAFGGPDSAKGTRTSLKPGEIRSVPIRKATAVQ